MTLPSAVEAFTSLLAYVVNPAARALALGCAAGLGLALFRVKTTCARLFTWTAVLYAAIAMPFLERMLPPLPVPTPSFLQHGVEQPGAKEVSTPVAAAQSVRRWQRFPSCAITTREYRGDRPSK